MTDPLQAKADAYYAARKAYDEAKALSNAADKERRDRERELVDHMLEHGINGLDRDDNTKISLVSSVSISVTKDKFEEIREWLRSEVGDDADFMEEIVSKPAVLEYVKKRLKDGDDTSDLPQFLNADTRPTVRVMGWKGVSGE